MIRSTLGTNEEERVQRWGSAAGTLLDGDWIHNAGKCYRSQIEHFIAVSMGLSDDGEMLAEDEVPFPLPNVWLGVSVEDQKTADERIPVLMNTPAAVRWVSYEPALGAVDFGNWMLQPHGKQYGCESIDWIVAGGESGPGARPASPGWFRSARDQCASVGVPFFFKQWGAYIPLSAGGDAVRGHKFFQVTDGLHQIPCVRVGKKAAGRLLDGREHSEYPA